VFLDKLTPYLQQELRKVGVEMEIRKVDWAFRPARRGAPVRRHFAALGNPTWCRIRTRSGILADQGRLELVFFKDPRADALIGRRA